MIELRLVRMVAAAVLLLAACSGGHRATTASSQRVPTAFGTITGRMYADGGPGHFPPVAPSPPHAVFGDISVEVAGTTRIVAHPVQDRNGVFRVSVPAGNYVVVGAPTDGFRSVGPLTVSVSVAAGGVAQADLGIHML